MSRARQRRFSGAMLAVAGVVAWPAAVLANDSQMGGSGTDLVPLQTTQVRMKSEDILITAVGRDWEVQADYVFENLSPRAVQMQVGFPEYACEGGGPDDDNNCVPKPLRFESLRTTVDGQPVEQRVGTIKDGHPWRPRLGQVWLYDVLFAPARETTITHHYRVLQGAISDGTVTGWYVTRTGATWAGSIGHARFRIHVPASSREASAQIERTGLTLTRQVVDFAGKKTGELLLEASDWEPKADVGFSFLDAPGSRGMATWEHVHSEQNGLLEPRQRCQNIVAMMTIGSMRAEPNPGDHIPPSDPTEDDVTRIALEGLGNAQVCRGYVYAAYGKRFDDDKWNRYFYGYDGWKPKGWPYETMQPNPEYSDALLQPGDRATLQLIDRVEARVMGAVARPLAPAAPAPAAMPASAPPAPAREQRGGCSVSRALGGSRVAGTSWLVLLAGGLRALRRRAAWPRAARLV